MKHLVRFMSVAFCQLTSILLYGVLFLLGICVAMWVFRDYVKRFLDFFIC